MEDCRYFAVCRNDGGVEWFELFEDNEEEVQEGFHGETRVNYLRADGSIKFKNKFVKSRHKEYLDIICPRCEAPMILIPFSMVDLAQRKEVFRMDDKARISFAEKYMILEGLEDDDEKLS